MSSAPRVQPAPSGTTSIPSRAKAATSPPSVASPVFMNWNMPTRIDRPAARRRSPTAAVVFPFPSPVFTISRPCRLDRGGTRYGPGLVRLGTGARRRAVGLSGSGEAKGSDREACSGSVMERTQGEDEGVVSGRVRAATRIWSGRLNEVQSRTAIPARSSSARCTAGASPTWRVK